MICGLSPLPFALAFAALLLAGCDGQSVLDDPSTWPQQDVVDAPNTPANEPAPQAIEEPSHCVSTDLTEPERTTLQEITQSFRKYDYAGDADKLRRLRARLSPQSSCRFSEALARLERTCSDFTQMVDYDGPFEHVFIHPPIAFPELAFVGDSFEKNLLDYFITVSEFKALLQQLYESNFVLMDIRLLLQLVRSPRTGKKSLRFPKGKRPLVFSIDDLNYYPYMLRYGMAHGLDLDDRGQIVAFAVRPDGTRVVSEDLDAVTILDRFVEEHPDFSFGGHKGILAVTGFHGVFGSGSLSRHREGAAQRLARPRLIAEALRATGWVFASHGFSHGHMRSMTFEAVQRDTANWKNLVAPVVGPTDIFVFPFGEKVMMNDPKRRHLVQEGFSIFCSVQSTPILTINHDNLLMGRRNIDGVAMRGGHLDDLLDVPAMIDPVRPVYVRDRKGRLRRRPPR